MSVPGTPSKLSEFSAFLTKHNVIGLAIGLVIGGAVTKLVSAVVNDLVMPVVGAMTPSGDWRKATVDVGPLKFGIGNLAGTALDFFIVAALVFFVVSKFQKEESK
jgi:large conductance mechanosensitive channel